MKIDPVNLDRRQSHDLIGSCIAPLPVALISTIGRDDIHNAAPFSFIAPVCSKPPILCVSFGMRQGEKKDTLNNIEFTHDFVINVADENLLNHAIKTSKDYPSDVDELKEAGLTAINSEKVKSPRVAEAKVSLECRLVQKMELTEQYPEGKGLRAIVFGEVVLTHIKDEVWVDGKIEPLRLGIVGRLGSEMYCGKAGIFKGTEDLEEQV